MNQSCRLKFYNYSPSWARRESWLLLEERKVRQALEARVFKYLEDEREDAREATRPLIGLTHEKV